MGVLYTLVIATVLPCVALIEGFGSFANPSTTTAFLRCHILIGNIKNVLYFSYIQTLSDVYTEPSSAKDDSARTHKTRSITFRLDSSVIDEMQREADQKETSLNVLVNQVLKRYTEWDRYEGKIGMMPVPKVMLSSLIDKSIAIAKEKIGIKDIAPYRDEILKSAAQIAFSIMKDSVLFMKKQYNLWVVLSVLQEYMKASGINSDHRIEDGRKHVFVIQHELGENWSLFTKELLKIIFESLANVKVEVYVTPNTTVAEVML